MAKTSRSKSSSSKKSASKSSSSGNGRKKSSSGGSRSGNSGGLQAGNKNLPLLEKFFHDQVRDMYWAEKALLKALPKMQKKATTEELQQAFEDHTAVTEEQTKRLEQVFEMLGKKPQAKKCEAMDGLIREAEEIIEETEDGSMTRDVALIMAAQKVEHYEIATYGGLVQLAHTMNRPELAEILEQTLQEEKDTDQLLTYIAENDINMEAEMEGASTEEE
ncbi:MAG TPA: ferritin-like domain-containing protein [Chitinophagaceae bacterium]|nr:ferritin-like domain-containing protein [Chitinophagaceae bacterium]